MPSFGHTTVGRNQKILYRQRCRREIEAAYSRVPKRRAPRTIEVDATNWLSLKRATFALSSFSIAESGLRLHLLPKLKKRLLSDIDAHTISRHQRQRLKEGASPKSINLEFGTLRALLRHHELWTDALRRDVRPLKVRDDHGRSLTVDEERRLTDACRSSRSPSLGPAFVVAMQTGLRYSELRMLRWSQVDFLNALVTVGDSKTAAGTGPQSTSLKRVEAVGHAGSRPTIGSLRLPG